MNASYRGSRGMFLPSDNPLQEIFPQLTVLNYGEEKEYLRAA